MWYTIKDSEVILRVLAKPNAHKTDLNEVTLDAMKVAIHAKPHEGEANKELIRFLSELLRVPKSQIKLHRGDTSRYKAISVPLTDSVQQFIDQHRK